MLSTARAQAAPSVTSRWRENPSRGVWSVPGYMARMTQKPYTPNPSEEDELDFDQLALEQIRKGEPDELDGPAADLDRTLDDEDPTNSR
jgi:hypothetical protein